MDLRKQEQFNAFHLTYIEISKIINEVLEENNIDISREQLGVFKLLLEYKKLTIKEIASSQGVFKTAISKRVKKLEDKGFVKKIESVDKREKVIALTQKGYEFYQNRQAILYEGLEKKFNLSKEENEALFKHIRDINSILLKDE